jgi:hypothetical protein
VVVRKATAGGRAISCIAACSSSSENCAATTRCGCDEMRTATAT